MTQPAPTNLLQAEAEFLASGMKLQAQALSVLLAEMRALSDVLPGAPHPTPHPTPAQTDAEIEADFDNMPV
jgi:hypothetical protein